MWIQTTEGVLVNSVSLSQIRLDHSDAKKPGKLAGIPPTGQAVMLATGTDNELGALYERLKIALVHNAPYVNLGDD